MIRTWGFIFRNTAVYTGMG